MIFKTQFIIEQRKLEAFREDRDKIIQIHKEEGSRKLGNEIEKHYPFQQTQGISIGESYSQYDKELFIVPYDVWMKFRNEAGREFPALRSMILELENK